MIVTLIGYRGCGKSTVAPLLARRLGCPWADSDALIERDAGMSIREIFASEGEAGFRARETQVLQTLLNGGRIVISAGGGAVLASENRRLMQAAGPVVWLQADAGTLADRVAGDAASAERRPSLTGRAIHEEIADVLAARTPMYEDAATLTIVTDGQTPEAIAQQISEQLEGAA